MDILCLLIIVIQELISVDLTTAVVRLTLIEVGIQGVLRYHPRKVKIGLSPKGLYSSDLSNPAWSHSPITKYPAIPSTSFTIVTLDE